MQIFEVKDRQYLKEIVDIHHRTFEGFFLTKLGKGFLTTLYRGYIEDADSGVIVALDDEKVVGFIAYSKDYSRFYSNLMKRKIVQFAFYSMLAVIRNPSFIKRLLGAFGKSDEVKRTEPYVELASIGVLPETKGQGVGSKLITWLIDIVDFNMYSYISLETDAEDNDAVNMFYKKNGFVCVRTYETKEKRKMNEYQYRKTDGEKDGF